MIDGATKFVGGAFAFDRSSVRSKDADGHLHIARSNISKATVNPYKGAEIPEWTKLGLDPDKVYQLLRDPDELKKAASTFDGKPLLFRHTPTTSDAHAYDDVVGAVSNPVYEHPYLEAELVVWPGAAIDAIERGSQQQLSSAYRYDADMTPGTYEGVAYDGVMRNIHGNHVALVTEGRAGPDVVVGDSALQMKEPTMKKAPLSRKAVATAGALSVYLVPKMAKDAKIDLRALLAKVDHKNFAASKPTIAADVKKALDGKLAKDATLDDLTVLLDTLEKADVDGTEDEDPNSAMPVTPIDGGAAAMDDDPLGKIKEFLKGKVSEDDLAKLDGLMAAPKAAADETEEEKKKREADEAAKRATDEAEAEAKAKEKEKDMVTKPAMDAAIAAATKATRDEVMRGQREVREAERAVRPFVGELAVACDSAEGVYREALKILGVKGAETIHASALPAILEMQQKPGAKPQREPRHAMDAASSDEFAKRFPNTTRIRAA